MTKNVPVVNVYRKKPPMKVRHIPTLNADGSEILDPVPLAADLVGVRPLTLEELYQKFTAHGDAAANLVYDDFAGDDDFHDDFDDLPENGLTRYEASDIQRQLASLPATKLKQIKDLLQNPKKPAKASKTVPDEPDSSAATTLPADSHTDVSE